MRIGFVGLGKMGLNMVTRLLQGGHEVVATDLSEDAVKNAEEKGATSAGSLDDLVSKLSAPRVVWVMVPSGKPTDVTIDSLSTLLGEGDIVIDGGNSLYKDSMKHADTLKNKGISFLDCGTSGGIWGLKVGYCLMIGGEEAAFKVVEPAFKTLAPEDGYAHVGQSGAGHFVKMVHNGIEYAMLQSYGEGFEILKAKEEFNLDFHQISHLWNQGSVIRSWLLELAEDAFKNEPDLASIKGFVADSGEGRWTVQAAIDENVPAPTIVLSLMERFRSRQDESFSAKFIAALRNEFGGHGFVKK
jgi:6-phosphogluconate dehydrogenase